MIVFNLLLRYIESGGRWAKQVNHIRNFLLYTGPMIYLEKDVERLMKKRDDLIYELGARGIYVS